jgi:hypothetical protein
MTDAAWRTWAARLGWLTAAAFLAGAAIVVFLQLTPPAERSFPPDATFVDHLLAEFEDAQSVWPLDLANSLLFAVGFAAIAGLGAVLRHVLGRDDPRGMVGLVALMVAGAVGVVAQLIYIGGTEVTTNPQYCDCGYLAEEIVSRQMIHVTLGGIVFWMIDAFTVLFAIGLLAWAAVGSASRTMPAGWVAFTRLLAVVGLAVVAWNRIAVPLLIQAGYDDVDYFVIGSILIGVVAGILVPIWAVWLARAMRPPDRTTGMPSAEEPAT